MKGFLMWDMIPNILKKIAKNSDFIENNNFITEVNNFITAFHGSSGK